MSYRFLAGTLTVYNGWYNSHDVAQRSGTLRYTYDPSTPALSKRSHPQASAGFSYRAVNNGSHQEEGMLTGRVNVKRWRQV